MIFNTASPSGAERDFTTPQTYTVTAQDGSSRVYTVTAIRINQPNTFAWARPQPGNWSDAAKWSNNLAPALAGHPDCILNFAQSASSAITNDLPPGFQLNQLILGKNAGGMTLAGNGVTFTKSSASGLLPTIHAERCQRLTLKTPLNLRHDLSVNTFPDRDPNCYIVIDGEISGPGALALNSHGDPDVPRVNLHDVHYGILHINSKNTYTGGTTVNGGRIHAAKAGALGTGRVFIENFGRLSTEAPLPNPLTINSGTLFHCDWSGPITLNTVASFIGDCDITGDISGPGGFTMLGTNGTYLNIVPGGTVILHGVSTYAGPTTVFPGTLVVKKAAGLYNADASKWTPANIAIHQSASLRLNVGGSGEFTGPQVGALLKHLTTNINNNGLMGGSFFCVDTANAPATVTISTPIADSTGPGGGWFFFKKAGPGALQLTGDNTYTGQTFLEDGTLIVSSLNSVANSKSASSLGAPTTPEAGTLELSGDCNLTYTGKGETTDRILDLAGLRPQTLTLDQSGSGLLRFTSNLLFNGFGHSKTLILIGSTTGAGEIAGSISNPRDRKSVATTSLTKSGSGTWTLSGANTYTGPTKVAQGTLSLTNPQALSPKTDVSLSPNATLDLNFSGEMRIRKLYLDGKLQPPDNYGAATAPKYIKGTGVLRNE